MCYYQLFGSEDSRDIDIVFFVDAIHAIQDSVLLAKALIQQLPQKYDQSRLINANLAVLEQGKIVDVYKGTPDELNNSLYHTYGWHIQDYPAQIKELLPRDIPLKYRRTLHKTLSYFTKTPYRKEVKAALRSGYERQMKCLKSIDLCTLDLGAQTQDAWKVITFSMVQSIALNKGVELYTKQQVKAFLPGVTPFINREKEGKVEELKRIYAEFMQASAAIPTLRNSTSLY